MGRLIQILGRLGRPMAGLPQLKEEIAMVDAGPGAEAIAAPAAETAKPAQGGGNKKGKKKGKK